MFSFPSQRHFDRGKVITKDRQAAYNQFRGQKRIQAADNHRPKITDLQSDEEQTTSLNEGQQSTPRIPKPPPIGVTNLKYHEVIKLIQNSPNQWEQMPTFSVREEDSRAITRIYTHDDKIYEEVINILNSANVQFFSNQRHTQKKTKIVMYGMPHINIEKIKCAFEAKFHVQPIDIKQLKSKKCTHLYGPRTYMLVFRKMDSVRVRDIREAVDTLFGIHVRFEYYTPRKFQITQCSNCQSFGHGEENCHKKSNCLRCGGRHHFKICPLLQTVPGAPECRKKIPDEKVKCANCGGPHTANYSKCPSRVNYLQGLQRANLSRKKSDNTFKFSGRDFPPLEKSKSNAWFKPQPSAPEIQTNSHQEFTLQLMQQQQQLMTTMTQMMDKMTQMLNTFERVLGQFNVSSVNP